MGGRVRAGRIVEWQIAAASLKSPSYCYMGHAMSHAIAIGIFVSCSALSILSGLCAIISVIRKKFWWAVLIIVIGAVIGIGGLYSLYVANEMKMDEFRIATGKEQNDYSGLWPIIYFAFGALYFFLISCCVSTIWLISKILSWRRSKITAEE